MAVTVSSKASFIESLGLQLSEKGTLALMGRVSSAPIKVFFINLSSPLNALISDSQAQVNIIQEA